MKQNPGKICKKQLSLKSLKECLPNTRVEIGFQKNEIDE
jgi:hypothetical protein